jgi:hypothetical protein
VRPGSYRGPTPTSMPIKLKPPVCFDLFHDSTGNSPFNPFAINSTAIAASIKPIILVKIFIPVLLIFFDIQGVSLKAVHNNKPNSKISATIKE